MRLSLFALLDHWRSPLPNPRKVAWVGANDYAHRGLHGDGVPENSLAAFSGAVAMGLGIELDIQRASDGQAVVFHDETLDRLTTESGPVSRWNGAQLGQIALAGTGQTIPTLRQALMQITGQVPVLIEIKTQRKDHVAALCLAVRRVLEGYGGPHAVISFDPRVARWYSRHSPHTVRALTITEDRHRGLLGMIQRRLSLWHAQPDFLTYDLRDMPSRFAAQQRARGLKVVTWTVKNRDDRMRAMENADAAIVEGGGVAPVAESTKGQS